MPRRGRPLLVIRAWARGRFGAGRAQRIALDARALRGVAARGAGGTLGRAAGALQRRGALLGQRALRGGERGAQRGQAIAQTVSAQLALQRVPPRRQQLRPLGLALGRAARGLPRRGARGRLRACPPRALGAQGGLCARAVPALAAGLGLGRGCALGGRPRCGLRPRATPSLLR